MFEQNIKKYLCLLDNSIRNKGESMSLFLGKIHFWLFDKIRCFENLETDILKFADKKGVSIDINKMYEEFGYPTEDKPLEEQIDTSNIHGWLQNQIQRAEYRQAYLVKSIIDLDSSHIDELKEVFKEHGNKIGIPLKSDDLTPKDAYETLNNFLLEGMPCDRTTEFLANDDSKISFHYTRCLHRDYWDEVGISIKYFYILRNEWIKSFINALDESLTFEVKLNDEDYENIEENIFSIVKI